MNLLVIASTSATGAVSASVFQDQLCTKVSRRPSLAVALLMVTASDGFLQADVLGSAAQRIRSFARVGFGIVPTVVTRPVPCSMVVMAGQRPKWACS